MSALLDDRRTSSSPARLAVAAVALALLAGLVYSNSLRNPFVYDDLRVARGIPPLHGLTDILSTVTRDFTRPIIALSYAIDATLWGPEPLGYHVTSLFLHLCNVVLVLFVSRAIATDAARRDATAPAPDPAFAAIVAAGIFAMHPLMTEAVGYISGRSEVLCATAFLLSFLSARKWMLDGGRTWWALAVVLWLLALGTKEVAVALPLVFYAYDRLLIDGSAVAAKRRVERLHLPLLTAIAILGGARLAVLALIEYPGDFRPDVRYAFVQLDVLLQYLALLVWPVGQTIYHGEPQVIGPYWWRAAVDVALVIGLVAAAVWIARKNRVLPLYAIWFATLVLPSSVLYLLGIGEAMAEHRVYLASAGVFMAAGWGAAWVALRLTTRGQRLMFQLLIVILGMHLAARTIIRNDVWRDPVTLWTEAIREAPREWLPRMALADVHREANRCEDAVPHYREGVALGGGDKAAYVKLAGCLMQLQRLEEARAVFTTLSNTEPDAADGPLGLALVAVISGSGDARASLREALTREPASIAARMLLASVYEKDEPAEALRLCREVRKMAASTDGVEACIARAAAALEARRSKTP